MAVVEDQPPYITSGCSPRFSMFRACLQRKGVNVSRKRHITGEETQTQTQSLHALVSEAPPTCRMEGRASQTRTPLLLSILTSIAHT